MTSLHDKIDIFYRKRNEIFKKPLEKIINIMLDKCKYINGESLERHNWGNNPIKLLNIPNISLASFEEDLLNALNLEENEKSIVELLWGDIQLGKRVQACIIMWISVHILKRPVLYIFRNLTIDQKQLQDDILGTEKYNFNIQFIKSLFEEFNNDLQEFFNEEKNIEYWKDYKLPELKDINSDNIINKLCNKDAINSNDIFCCLMNHTQLEKINAKFSEYIYYNDELVNITILVDESDLMSPTSSNDQMNKNDLKDSTACEILLAKIYKKVKYALHITGTAHSLLYNITTRLSDNTNIQIKVSKVHKMKRSNDYFGLFNDSINYNTTLVESWWDYQDIENNNKKPCYDIAKDYNINIKKIIEEILKRPTIKYNSLLISEEKIRENQFFLVDKIINDFSDLFIVIYHGKCLRLYLSKKYEKELKRLSQWDSEESSTSQRLWQLGGVYGSSIDAEKFEKLPNNYCYFSINTKILNIKFVYKLLRILFEKSGTSILYKTIITITGKYGERGYSFTSDDYDIYSLHLTDQYFVSHASLNCTDISQRLRLQGKYNDLELKNGLMKLTLWTTPKLYDIIQNFYVRFIKEIEKFIMKCENWEEIKDLLENKIFDNGELKFGKYMKYIDASKKQKNIKKIKRFDKEMDGYSLISIDDMNDDDLIEWCKEKKLPNYVCINEIKEIDCNEFIDKYGIYKPLIPIKEYKQNINISNKQSTLYYLKQKFPNCNKYSIYIPTTDNMNRKIGINTYILNKKEYNYSRSKPNECIIINYIDENYYHIVGSTDIKDFPKQTNDYLKKNPYVVNGDKVKYTVIKDEYNGDTELPFQYYWKTPDEWLYLYDRNKPEIFSLEIIHPSLNIVKETLINNDILLFANSCCKKTDKQNLRFGIKDIYEKYELWCKLNGKTILKKLKKFKEEFEKLDYKEEISKGIGINKNSGKRGYNIDLKTNL